MGKGHTENIKIQGLLDSYLRINSNKTNYNEKHLDDDSLSAFVEGKLTKLESGPIVSHLVGCGFCRNVTSELVKLEFAFADEAIPERIAASEPSRVSEVLNGLFSRLFGSSMGEVFAHHEIDEEKKIDKEAEEK